MSSLSTSAPIRLILVDDHVVLRAGLANVLSFEPDMQVVAQGNDGESAIELWRKHQPDIMLLDLCMPGIDGVETLQRLRREFPAARVLIQRPRRHPRRCGMRSPPVPAAM